MKWQILESFNNNENENYYKNMESEEKNCVGLLMEGGR